jgi:hypothetical protein
MPNEKPIVIKKLCDLRPYEKNAKIHTPEQVERIANSIKSFGFRGSIAVKPDGEIINGHGRVLACKSLGYTTIPCIVIDDMSEEQIQAYRLADNKTNEGGYDADLLNDELLALSQGGLDMSLFFSEKELSFVMDDMGEIELEGLSDSLAEEVDGLSSATQDRIDQEDEQQVSVQKALGFNKVTPAQQRALRRFMDFIEERTGHKGAPALVEFSRDFMGL